MTVNNVRTGVDIGCFRHILWRYFELLLLYLSQILGKTLCSISESISFNKGPSLSLLSLSAALSPYHIIKSAVLVYS